MNTVVKADAEFVIWLIVGLFWVVAQIAGSAGKKKAPPRPQSEGGEEPPPRPEDPFAELVRKLSGVQEFKIPKPPEPKEIYRPKPARKPDVANQYGLTADEVEALPEINPLKRAAPPSAPVPAAMPVEVPDVDIRPTMSSFRNTLPAMKLPAMRLHFQCAPHHDRDVDSGKDAGRIERLELKGRRNLRRAMLNHIIFSKPKALE